MRNDLLCTYRLYALSAGKRHEREDDAKEGFLMRHFPQLAALAAAYRGPG